MALSPGWLINLHPYPILLNASVYILVIFKKKGTLFGKMVVNTILWFSFSGISVAFAEAGKPDVITNGDTQIRKAKRWFNLNMFNRHPYRKLTPLVMGSILL